MRGSLGDTMQRGFVGLGKMGLNMVTRLVRGGHDIVSFDRSADLVAKAETPGAPGAATLQALGAGLTPPRAVWAMGPAGAPTRATAPAPGPLMAAAHVR